MKVRLYLMLLLATAMVAGCSNDDDEGLAAHQATFSTDLYSLGLSLRNEKGQNATTFKEKENIFFEVTVYNTTGSEIRLADERFFSKNNIAVYRSNGEYVGAPWIPEAMTEELRWFRVDAHGQRHWSLPWLSDNYLNPIALPKGTYYASVKGRLLKNCSNDDSSLYSKSGFDDIEMSIPFTVE